MENKNHVITRANRAECGAVCQNDRLSAGHIWQTRSHAYGEVKCQTETQRDVVIPNELGNGETCQGLRHWRLLSNLKNNFSKPVRNDMTGSLALGGRGLGRGGNSLQTDATTCPPLEGGPKSLISRRGKNARNCFSTYNNKKGRHPEGTRAEDIRREPYPFNASVKSLKYLSTNYNQEPSPEFVSSSQLTNKFYPLTGREGEKEMVTNLFPYFPISFSPKKKLAFTLAEVLITLGIIGVVAAITIPGLMNNYKANKLRTQFLKTYSTVQQAFKLMQEDDVSLDPASYNRHEGQVFYNTYKKYLKGITDCGTYTKKSFPCYDYRKEIYKTLNGKAVVEKTLFDDGQVVLQDGTLLAFEQPDGDWWILVLADINGINNPPNRLGYDLFVFEFLDGELRTMGEKGTFYNSPNYCDKDKNWKSNGMSCAFRAKSESDYFKWVVKNIK